MSAIFNILVKVDAKDAKAGANDVKGVLGELTGAAAKATGAVAGLWAAFAVKDAIEGLGAMVQAYQDIQNKLRVVTSDQASLNSVSAETLKIANETRTSWAATVTLFSRISQNATELNLGSRQILDFTKQVSTAVTISGATAQESHAALIQLSQGMASGALRGDELRSVMEQLPTVADVIAKHFGATRGELRALGRDGKLTSKEIIAAFSEASTTLESQFGRTIPTLSQAWQQFSDQATNAIGKIDQAAGVSRALTAIMTQLSHAIGEVGGSLSSFIKEETSFGIVFSKLAEIEDAIAQPDRIKKFNENMQKALDRVKDTSKSVADLQAVGVKITFPTELATQVAKASVVFNQVFGVTVPQDFDETTKHVQEVETALDKLVAKHHHQIINEEAMKLAETQHGYNEFLDTTEKHWDGIETKVRQTRQLLMSLVTAGPQTKAGLGVGGQQVIDIINNPLGTLGNKPHDPWANDPDTSADFAPNPTALRALALRTQSWIQLLDDTDKAQRELTSSTDVYGAELDKIKQKTRDLAVEELRIIDLHNRKKITDEEFAREMKKFRGPKAHEDPDIARLDSLLKKLGDVQKAELELAAARKLISKQNVQDELARRGLRGANVLNDFEGTLGPRLHPFSADLGKIVEETELMQGSAREFEHSAALRKIVNDLTEKYDRELLPEEIAILSQSLDIQEKRRIAWEHEKKILEEIKSPLREYGESVAAVRALQVDKKISDSEAEVVLAKLYENYVKQDAILSKTKGELAANVLFQTQLNKALADTNINQTEAIRLAREHNRETTSANDSRYGIYQAQQDQDKHGLVGGKQITELREGLKALYADIENTSVKIVSSIKNANDALLEMVVNAAETGEFAWKSFLKSILHIVNELIVQLLEAALLRAIVNGASGGSVGAASGLAHEALHGGGFADGGTYRVGGYGGPDSQRVLFDLTPGELVHFQPPGRGLPPVVGHRATYTETGEYGIVLALISALLGSNKAQVAPSGGGKSSVSVHNHWDRRELLPAINTPEGHTEVINVIRKNPEAIKAILRK